MAELATQQLNKGANTGSGFLNPEKVTRELGLRTGMSVADFGTGSGFFALAAAKIVGETGKVYALDVQKEILSHLKAKADLQHLTNLETVWVDLERPNGSRLKNASQDVVLLANVLFQIEKPSVVLSEVRRVLKSGGIFLLIDWKTSSFPGGPEAGRRLDPDSVRSMAKESGLTYLRECDAGSSHFGMVFQAP